MERENFLKHLEEKSLIIAPKHEISHQEEEAEPLKEDPILFWQGSEIPSNFLQDGFEKPKQDGILPKSLGKFPF